MLKSGIHEIIERKQNLIDDMIEKDDQDQIKYLSRDELIAILETVSVE